MAAISDIELQDIATSAKPFDSLPRLSLSSLQ